MGDVLSLSLRQEHDETQTLAISPETITGVGVVASRVLAGGPGGAINGATWNLLQGNICWFLGLHPISAGCKPLVDISEAKDPSSGGPPSSQVLPICLVSATHRAASWCARLSFTLSVCVYLSVRPSACPSVCLSLVVVVVVAVVVVFLAITTTSPPPPPPSSSQPPSSCYHVIIIFIVITFSACNKVSSVCTGICRRKRV